MAIFINIIIIAIEIGFIPDEFKTTIYHRDTNVNLVKIEDNILKSDDWSWFTPRKEDWRDDQFALILLQRYHMSVMVTQNYR